MKRPTRPSIRPAPIKIDIPDASPPIHGEFRIAISVTVHVDDPSANTPDHLLALLDRILEGSARHGDLLAGAIWCITPPQYRVLSLLLLCPGTADWQTGRRFPPLLWLRAVCRLHRGTVAVSIVSIDPDDSCEISRWISRFRDSMLHGSSSDRNISMTPTTSNLADTIPAAIYEGRYRFRIRLAGRQRECCRPEDLVDILRLLLDASRQHGDALDGCAWCIDQPADGLLALTIVARGTALWTPDYQPDDLQWIWSIARSSLGYVECAVLPLDRDDVDRTAETMRSFRHSILQGVGNHPEAQR